MSGGGLIVAAGVAVCLLVVVVAIVNDVFIREKLTEWSRLVIPAAVVAVLAFLLLR